MIYLQRQLTLSFGVLHTGFNTTSLKMSRNTGVTSSSPFFSVPVSQIVNIPFFFSAMSQNHIMFHRKFPESPDSRRNSRVSRLLEKSPDSRKNLAFLPEQVLLELSPSVKMLSLMRFYKPIITSFKLIARDHTPD